MPCKGIQRGGFEGPAGGGRLSAVDPESEEVSEGMEGGGEGMGEGRVLEAFLEGELLLGVFQCGTPQVRPAFSSRLSMFWVYKRSSWPRSSRSFMKLWNAVGLADEEMDESWAIIL